MNLCTTSFLLLPLISLTLAVSPFYSFRGFSLEQEQPQYTKTVMHRSAEARQGEKLTKAELVEYAKERLRELTELNTESEEELVPLVVQGPVIKELEELNIESERELVPFTVVKKEEEKGAGEEVFGNIKF